jgi:hypothetical protein
MHFPINNQRHADEWNRLDEYPHSGCLKIRLHLELLAAFRLAFIRAAANDRPPPTLYVTFFETPIHDCYY